MREAIAQGPGVSAVPVHALDMVDSWGRRGGGGASPAVADECTQAQGVDAVQIGR